jgi:hypothetical protein
MNGIGSREIYYEELIGNKKNKKIKHKNYFIGNDSEHIS